MSKGERYRTRLLRQRAPSLSGAEPTAERGKPTPKADAIIDCGWGRLIFAHTFRDNRRLADALLAELPGKRDIAFYVSDPHVLLAMEPQNLFLDPSHTYRLWLDRYTVAQLRPRGFSVRLLNKEAYGAIRVMITMNQTGNFLSGVLHRQCNMQCK